MINIPPNEKENLDDNWKNPNDFIDINGKEVVRIERPRITTSIGPLLKCANQSNLPVLFSDIMFHTGWKYKMEQQILNDIAANENNIQFTMNSAKQSNQLVHIGQQFNMDQDPQQYQVQQLQVQQMQVQQLQNQQIQVQHQADQLQRQYIQEMQQLREQQEQQELQMQQLRQYHLQEQQIRRQQQQQQHQQQHQQQQQQHQQQQQPQQEIQQEMVELIHHQQYNDSWTICDEPGPSVYGEIGSHLRNRSSTDSSPKSSISIDEQRIGEFLLFGSTSNRSSYNSSPIDMAQGIQQNLNDRYNRYDHYSEMCMDHYNLCGSCQFFIPVVHCFDCEESYCKSCTTYHGTKMRCDHSLSDINHKFYSPLPSPSKNSPKTVQHYDDYDHCDVHDDKQRFVCLNCKIIVCQECTFRDHSNHSTESIFTFIHDPLHVRDKLMGTANEGKESIKRLIDGVIINQRNMDKDVVDFQIKIRKVVRTAPIAPETVWCEENNLLIQDVLQVYCAKAGAMYLDQQNVLRTSLAGIADVTTDLKNYHKVYLTYTDFKKAKVLVDADHQINHFLAQAFHAQQFPISFTQFILYLEHHKEETIKENTAAIRLKQQQAAANKQHISIEELTRLHAAALKVDFYSAMVNSSLASSSHKYESTRSFRKTSNKVNYAHSEEYNLQITSSPEYQQQKLQLQRIQQQLQQRTQNHMHQTQRQIVSHKQRNNQNHHHHQQQQHQQQHQQYQQHQQQHQHQHQHHQQSPFISVPSLSMTLPMGKNENQYVHNEYHQQQGYNVAVNNFYRTSPIQNQYLINMNEHPKAHGRCIYNLDMAVCAVRRNHHNPSISFGYDGSNHGELSRPWGCCVDKDGNIIIGDRRNNRIQVFYPNGQLKLSFGQKGSGDGELELPAGITVDRLNRIVVADKDNHRVQIFSSNGQFILKFGKQGRDLGEFQYPWDVASNSNGEIAVSDTRNHRIQLFSAMGHFITKYSFDACYDRTFKANTTPRGICFTPSGDILVTDFENHRLLKMDGRLSEVREVIGTEGQREREFNRPSGICCDDSGQVIVADSKNQRIVVYNTNNTKLEYKWMMDMRSNLPELMNEKDRPCDVAVLPNGSIVVVFETSPDTKDIPHPLKTFVQIF